MEASIITQLKDRIIKTGKGKYIYVLEVKDRNDNGTLILYIEQSGQYGRSGVKFGEDSVSYFVIPITEEIEAYNKYFYQFFEPTERMKNYIKKMEESKK